MLELANRLQATAPIVAWAVVILCLVMPDLYFSELPVRATTVYLAMGLGMIAMIGTAWILSDRSSRQEERIQKLEDELDLLRKSKQD